MHLIGAFIICYNYYEYNRIFGDNMKNIIIEKLKRDISTITTEEWKIIASDDELYNIAHR